MEGNEKREPELSPKDRISQLPFELILHLLTFFSQKEAAPLKQLSRSWRKNISATNLHFFCEEFDRLGEEKFEIYLRNTLLNREKMQVDKLEIIRLDEKCDEWLDYAAQNKVKVLHLILRCDGKDQLKLPQSIQKCESLEELVILSYPKLELVAETLNLTSLKKLIIQSTIIKDELTDQIQISCPSLEELHFVICRLENSEIRSKSLKKLTIERCRVGFGFEYEEFGIFTPNLEYLWYNVFWQGLLCKKPVRANYVSDVSTKLLLEIPNITSLTLGGLWLTHDCHAVSYFLSESSKLEQLMLLCNSPMIYPVPNEIVGFINFPFHCPNLETIQILSSNKDSRIPYITEILTRNGISQEKIHLKSIVTKNCYRAGVKTLETLHKIWGWIERNVEKKFDEFARKLGKTREELKEERIRKMNERMREILSGFYQIDASVLMELMGDDFLFD